MMTKAQLAMAVVRINRIVAMVITDLAEGMGNPNFCAANAQFEANLFVQEIQRAIYQISDRANS